jgi:hypothetical protein
VETARRTGSTPSASSGDLGSLVNSTDVPDHVVRSLLRQMAPPDVIGFDVNLGNCALGESGDGYHGRVYPSITIRLPRGDVRTRWSAGRARRRHLAIDVGSRLEVLVVLLARELRHLWQAQVPRGQRVWGERRQFSTKDADAYALHMLRRYRRGELRVAASDLPARPGVTSGGTPYNSVHEPAASDATEEHHMRSSSPSVPFR